jgi:DNA-directed RNA polymerase subunit N (RpoN/RPB10)
MVKVATMLKWDLKKAKKECWSVFSRYVRLRDQGVCFTCEKKIPDYYNRQGKLIEGWKSGQAGHWITAASCGLALYFHEKNVHCQCYHCNINLSGNWLEYERKIRSVYGDNVCEELKALKWTGSVKYTVQDYVGMIVKYNELVQQLMQKGQLV